MIRWLLPMSSPRRNTAHGQIHDLEEREFWAGYTGHSTASQQYVNDDTAMTYSACWAATRILAGTLGWIPFNFYKRMERGRQVMKDDYRNILVNSRPNSEMTAMPFRMQAVSQQVNAGNCYAEIERDRAGRAIALWPIHYSRVTLYRAAVQIVDENGEIVAEPKQLFYEVRNDATGPIYIPQRDMLHVPSIHSNDGLSGKGVIRFGRESIGMGLATERYGASWFGKGGIPRIIVKTPGNWDKTARDAFRSEWSQIYGGSDGSRVGLLQGGADFGQINITNEDSQFLTTRQHNIEEIARWYGVPLHMLHHLLRMTYNNVEQLGIDFVNFGLILWGTLWEQQCNEKLLSDEERSEYYFKFNFNALLRGDAKTRSEFYRVMIFGGMMSPNEARELEDMNPYEGGDTFVMQSAMVPVDMLDEIAKPEPTPAQPNDPPKDDAAAKEFAAAMQKILDDTRAANERIEERMAGFAPKPDGREAALMAAASVMLRGALGRMYRVEAAQAKNAADKPGSFLRWLEGFFGEQHIETFRDAIGPSCEAMVILGVAIDADAIARAEVNKSKAELLEKSGVEREAFTETIISHVSEWEKSRAAALVESLTKAAA